MHLRTRHVLLNKHLACIGKVASPASLMCDRHDNTVHHFLFRCRAYNEHRKMLELSLERHGKSSKTLLTPKCHTSTVQIYWNLIK